jgi:hypothetical protein
MEKAAPKHNARDRLSDKVPDLELGWSSSTNIVEVRVIHDTIRDKTNTSTNKEMAVPAYTIHNIHSYINRITGTFKKSRRLGKGVFMLERDTCIRSFCFVYLAGDYRVAPNRGRYWGICVKPDGIVNKAVWHVHLNISEQQDTYYFFVKRCYLLLFGIWRYMCIWSRVELYINIKSSKVVQE